MLITKKTRQTAIVNHEVQYEVDEQYWNSLLEKGMNQEEALDEARSQGETESVSYSTELIEPIQDHEIEIS